MLKKIQKVLPLVSLVLGLLLLFSGFFTVLSADGNSIMNGMKAIFGGSAAAIGSFNLATVNFSFLNFLAFFLPAIISIGIAIYGMVNQEMNLIKSILGVVLAVAFVLSVIFISTLPANTTATTAVLGTVFNYGSADLAIGAILGLVFSILGAITSILYTVMQFAKK